MVIIMAYDKHDFGDFEKLLEWAEQHKGDGVTITAPPHAKYVIVEVPALPAGLFK